MKKLLVTASTFPRWEKDTEPRFVLDLCKAMSEYFDITVLVPAYPGAKDKDVLEGIKVIRYHYFPIHAFETLCYPGAIVPRIKERKIRMLLVPFLFGGLFLALKKNLKKYDMVHSHWLIPQGIVQIFFDKPYIVTGHGGDVYFLNKGLIRKLKICCIKKATHVTVVSEKLKNKVLELVPDKKVHVIPMGVDISSFGPQYRIENYFGQGDKKVVLFVGRLAEIKGIKYLIDAMRFIDAKLVIVGDGPLKSELIEQARIMALQNEENISSSNTFPYIFGKVEFLGNKTHEELKSIYASADIFAMPSVTAKDGGQEGFGLVMLEAMASGIPVVASNSGGIPQLIHDGENGILCEEKNIWQIADSITSLIEDTELYAHIKKNGYETTKKNSFSIRANEIISLISQD